MLATVARLRRKAEAKDDSVERRVARRVLQGTYVRAYEQARDLRERKNYTLAALELEVVTAIRPERPLGFYDLAATCALAGDKKRAVENLKRAVEKGFKDAARMEQDRALAGLRQEAGFRRLVEEVKKQ
jgi:predicted Zn-dependent protease